MKKIMHLSKYLLILVLIAGFSGCKKDNLTLLTDGVWKFDKISTNSNNELVQDVITLTSVLMTGSTLQFFDDGTYEMDSPLLDEPTTGTWELVGNSLLTMTPDGEVPDPPSTIDELSKDKLVLIDTLVDDEGATFNTTTSYKR